jgi:hypothetical protein
VPEDEARRIVEAVDGSQVAGRPLRVELARV